MGIRQSKKLSVSPPPKTLEEITVNSVANADYELHCRTPNLPHIPINNFTPANAQLTRRESLRKCVLKGLQYDLDDPRSPNIFLNRTPLVFDDSTDCNSDLEVSVPHVTTENDTTNPPLADDAPKELIGTAQIEEGKPQNLSSPESGFVLVETVVNERDPRSPSIGVDRTPIVFLDEQLEDGTTPSQASVISETTPHIEQFSMHREKPMKPLGPAFSRRHHGFIFEDQETSTPTKVRKNNVDSPLNDVKRTPLRCLKNQTQFRSRSAEITGKSTALRLPLTSYDDAIDKITPAKKILRYSNMENIEVENSIEF